MARMVDSLAGTSFTSSPAVAVAATAAGASPAAPKSSASAARIVAENLKKKEAKDLEQERGRWKVRCFSRSKEGSCAWKLICCLGLLTSRMGALAHWGHY